MYSNHILDYPYIHNYENFLGEMKMEAIINNEEQLREEAFADYMPRAALNKRGYHWVEREIEKLDPYTHYEQIWTLTTATIIEILF